MKDKEEAMQSCLLKHHTEMLSRRLCEVCKDDLWEYTVIRQVKTGREGFFTGEPVLQEDYGPRVCKECGIAALKEAQ